MKTKLYILLSLILVFSSQTIQSENKLQNSDCQKLNQLEERLKNLKPDSIDFNLWEEYRNLLNKKLAEKQKLESTTGKVWQNSAWVNKDLTEYTYEGYYVNSVTNKQWNGVAWDNTQKTTTTYDSQGNPLEDAKYVWSGGTWVKNSTLRYIYNAQGQVIEKVIENISGGISTPSTKTIKEYYPDGKLKKDTQLKYSGGGYINEWEWIYNYLANEKLGETIISNFNPGTWRQSHKYTYAYDSFTNLVETILFYKSTSEWAPAIKTIESYYNSVFNALLKDEIQQNYSSSSLSWINYSKKDFSYTATSNLEVQINSQWNYSGSAWASKEKYTHYYNEADDESGNLQEVILNDIWTYKYKNENIYQQPPVKKTLSVSISPAKAAQNACSVSPSVGNHEYNLNTTVTLTASDNPADGWIFKEWTGNASGSAKTASVMMDVDKTVTANFAEVTLTVSGSRAYEFACPGKFETNKRYNMLPINLTASPDDDWRVTRIKIKSVANRHKEADDISSVNLYQNGVNIFSGFFMSFSDFIEMDFLNPILIPKGTTVTLQLTYDFRFNPLTYINDEISTFMVFTESVNGTPVNYSSGKILGRASSEDLIIGRVLNTRSLEVFSGIQNAINSNLTRDNDTCLVCAGTYTETLNINKSLGIKSYDGAEKTIIQGFPVFAYGCNGTSLKGFTFSLFDSELISIFQKKKLKFEENIFFIRMAMFSDCDEISLIKNKFINISYLRFVEVENSILDGNELFSGIENQLVFDNCKYNSIKNNYASLIEVDNSKFPGSNLYGSIDNVFEGNTLMEFILSGSSGNKILKNKISNGSGNGIKLLDNPPYYANNNLISDNEIYNIKLSAIYSLGGADNLFKNNKITGSKICGMYFKNSHLTEITGNDLRQNEYNGMYFEDCTFSKVINNNVTNHTNGDGSGVFLLNCNNIKIFNNTLLKNCTGIKLQNSDLCTIGMNRIINSLCLFSGISMVGSGGEIISNSIEDNNGNGIYTASGSNPLIKNNNISGNSGFNLNNADPNIRLNASGNYWGGATGPSQNTINGNINTSSWLNSRVMFSLSIDEDTLKIPNTQTDSVMLSIQNHSNSPEQVTVTVTDPPGWLISPNTFILNVSDSLGVSQYLKFTIPSNPQVQSNKILISARRASAPNEEYKDSLVIVAYNSQFSKIIVVPDTVHLAPKSQYQFRAECYDQNGNLFNYTPAWSATGGTIDQTGLYTADSIKGSFKVTASYPGGTLRGECAVFIDDQKGKIKGSICYDNSSSTPLTNVTVKLKSEADSSVVSTTTNSAGAFTFSNLNNGNYSITLSGNTSWGGVNATDALLIRRYTSGYAPLYGLRYVAADVDLSGSVNSTDALLVGQRFIGQSNSFPAGNWVFDSLSASVYSDSLSYRLSGICTGDVNGSYLPGAAKLQPNIQYVKNGQIILSPKQNISLQFKADKEFCAGAISFVLSYPKESLTLNSINGMKGKADYNAKDGKIFIYWFDINQFDYKQNEPLFTLNFEKGGDVSALNKINIEPESEIADVNGNILKGITISTPTVESGLPADYTLMQNYPNPFNPVTIINYSLPKKSAVSLVIYDMLGREVKTLVSEEKDAGYYSVEWRGENNLGQKTASGMYIYKLKAGNFTSVKKMLILK